MEYKPSFTDQLDENYISHYGILGQRWGVRRYQNSDGSLTPEGRVRYSGNYKKAYDTVTKRHLFGFYAKRSPEHTGLLGTRMNNEAFDKIASTPAYARANQVGYSKEYLRSTTKSERKAEQDLATRITRNEQHDFFIESLDKYSDILAKDFGLNINQLGVRDACRQALIDKGGVDKGFAEWALNYKPDRLLPKNYRFKGLE